METAYLSLDAHARHCTLGLMNQDGTYLDTWRFSTSEAELIEHLVSIKAKHKVLTLEEGPLAFWIARAGRRERGPGRLANDPGYRLEAG